MPKTIKQSKAQPRTTEAMAITKAARTRTASPLPNGAPAPTEAAPTPKVGKQTTPPEKLESDRKAAGETLVALAAKATDTAGADTVATLAAKLVKGTLSNAGLVELRDAINALSAKLRDADKGTLAKQFAVANRGVRRLVRATREDAK